MLRGSPAALERPKITTLINRTTTTPHMSLLTTSFSNGAPRRMPNASGQVGFVRSASVLLQHDRVHAVEVAKGLGVWLPFHDVGRDCVKLALPDH